MNARSQAWHRFGLKVSQEHMITVRIVHRANTVRRPFRCPFHARRGGIHEGRSPHMTNKVGKASRQSPGPHLRCLHRLTDRHNTWSIRLRASSGDQGPCPAEQSRTLLPMVRSHQTARRSFTFQPGAAWRRGPEARPCRRGFIRAPPRRPRPRGESACQPLEARSDSNALMATGPAQSRCQLPVITALGCLAPPRHLQPCAGSLTHFQFRFGPISREPGDRPKTRAA